MKNDFCKLWELVQINRKGSSGLTPLQEHQRIDDLIRKIDGHSVSGDAMISCILTSDNEGRIPVYSFCGPDGKVEKKYGRAYSPRLSFCFFITNDRLSEALNLNVNDTISLTGVIDCNDSNHPFKPYNDTPALYLKNCSFSVKTKYKGGCFQILLFFLGAILFLCNRSQ